MKKIFAIIIGLFLLNTVTAFAQQPGFIPGCTDAQCDINYNPNTQNPRPLPRPSGSSAPQGGTCGTTISSYSEYRRCCTVFSSQSECVLYEENMRDPVYCANNPGYCPVTGMVNSGQPTSGTLATNPINQNRDPLVGGLAPSSVDLAACSDIKFKSLLDIMIWVKCIIMSAILPFIFAAALLFFMWGVLQFIRASDSNMKENAKKYIMGGMIGLFVMVSLWGIVRIVGNTLGLDNTVPLLQTEYLDPNKASR